MVSLFLSLSLPMWEPHVVYLLGLLWQGAEIHPHFFS